MCQQSEPDATAASAFSVWLFQRPSASKLSMNFPCFCSGTNQKEQDQQPLFNKMGQREADNRAVITSAQITVYNYYLDINEFTDYLAETTVTSLYISGTNLSHNSS